MKLCSCFMNKKDFVDFLGNKKFQWAAAAIILLLIIMFSSSIRLSNLPLLVDETTGENIPLALDPFYFLRMAEMKLELGGLPEHDPFRIADIGIGWSEEILPEVILGMYKVWNVFGDYSIQYVDVICPVVFFILGLLVFFFLSYLLTKSKLVALISSGFLAFSTAYLYRTMAGFSDHESVGMFAFLLSIFILTLSLKYLSREKINLLYSGAFGLVTGLGSAFVIASWGGVAKFTFMIIPLSFFIFWLVKQRGSSEGNIKDNKKRNLNYVLFYLSFFVFSILFGLMFGFGFSYILDNVFLGSTSLFNGFVLLFILADYFLVSYLIRKKYNFVDENYQQVYSFIIVLILGIVGLVILGKNPFLIFGEIISRLINPFGTGRIGLTVAENAQPFLVDWFSQFGKTLFWLFVGGSVFVGFMISRGVKKSREKIIFNIFWVLMILGILFSRYSSDSILNGGGIFSLSGFIYFGSIILFFGYSIYLYLKEDIKFEYELAIIVSWLLITLIAGRGAARLFFAITPFVCFIGGYFIVNIWNFLKRSKEDVMRIILICILVVSLFAGGYTLYISYQSSSTQAPQTGPSANYQWQNAMGWVRNNTSDKSVFGHWWDYGYWVQYLGERATISDGGHFQGDHVDHNFGRYVLTTTNPDSAMSFLKTYNVSYLLIDSTDLGKYGAYSRIGSDESGEDRYSWIPVIISDDRQMQETADSIIRVYSGGAAVDEDIIYTNDEGRQIFLPAYKSSLIGFILAEKGNGQFEQPIGVYLYNGQQYRIPFRYFYFDNKLIDFKEGLNATARSLPVLKSSQAGVVVDELGAAIYLSPKTSGSLFAQLYLMDDPLNMYPSFEVAHSEEDLFIGSLKSQGLEFGEFLYYNGFRGPIKMWKTNYPADILPREEFFERDIEYAQWDNLTFRE